MATFDPISYVLSKKYTNETVIGGGALKGAPCTIDKIEARIEALEDVINGGE